MGQKPSKLFDEEILNDFTNLSLGQIQFICQQTNLVDKEVCRRHREFLKFIQDGRMSKEQLTEYLQNIWPNGNVLNFSDYIFNLCDSTKKGFIASTEFIILDNQLSNDKSYLGLVFDMIDTRQKGFVSQEKIEKLLSSLFELIGHPLGEQEKMIISQQQINYLMKLADENNTKRLTRHQFINVVQTNWTDEENGLGSLLTENSC